MGGHIWKFDPTFFVQLKFISNPRAFPIPDYRSTHLPTRYIAGIKKGKWVKQQAFRGAVRKSEKGGGGQTEEEKLKRGGIWPTFFLFFRNIHGQKGFLFPWP